MYNVKEVYQRTKIQQDVENIITFVLFGSNNALRFHMLISSTET